MIKVPCAYRFIPIDSESDICECIRLRSLSSLLTLSRLRLAERRTNDCKEEKFGLQLPLIKHQGLLLPDEVVSITFTAYVDNNAAARLNLRPKTVDLTLVLHTLMGKDHFISVVGEYRQCSLVGKRVG